MYASRGVNIYITGIHDKNFIIPLLFTSGAVATYHSIAPQFILVFSRICVGYSSFLYSDWFITVLSSYPILLVLLLITPLVSLNSSCN